ncbi:uncharacterized protein K460DRAFT_368020 [Cucurbitaria berberidis CBS 394.84]|uniref:Uncharacterized protein n=1 Tax=Cucurbitaria berberidis CBS 394.84 TaxID=1168544 RepID=A0A9P4GC12_9PLEO|nr:uncharacterized protein K460DRAFT_368020 [Cucurbitaria berberidis CBS 394.84]KAF1843093.1 hypothetical protein K460DRAFT_368020 [Cucurbitaria berberidis CBS 394.84]
MAAARILWIAGVLAILGVSFVGALTRLSLLWFIPGVLCALFIFLLKLNRSSAPPEFLCEALPEGGSSYRTPCAVGLWRMQTETLVAVGVK